MEYRGYEISKIEHGFRVTLLNSNQHSHLSTKNSCIKAVDYVQSKKIPRRVGNYYLTTLIRLSTDEEYISRVQELIDVRMSKGKKEKYYNSRIK